MASYQTSLKSWGAIGEEPPDNYSYEKGEQPTDAWDNWVNYNLINDVEHLVQLTNDRLESTKSGLPNSPEPGHMSYQEAIGIGYSPLKWWDDNNGEWLDALPRSEESVNAIEGSTTLSGGYADVRVPPAQAGAGTPVNILLDPSGGGNNTQDVKLKSRVFWDSSENEHHIEIIEDGTSVGNPEVHYTIIHEN